MSATGAPGPLAGRVAVVTGGNGGIGLGMATALATAGADIVIWARNEEKNAGAVAALEPLGTRVLAMRCDVSDEDQVVATMAGTVEAMGKVDALVANAGIGGFAPFTQMGLAEFRRVTAVNLDGAFLTMREAAAHMVARGEGGALVAVSSVSAIHGAPGMEHYAASKAGLLAIVRGAAVELARHQIRVNALLPGWTDTEMIAPATANQKFVDTTVRRTPMRRWGEPADMGPAAVYLADPSHAFHTGDSIVVDGGYSIF
jgi:NAD(P)-dependent dehydrogenase (short-subunit alcohol dehydrogenase family)